MSKNFFSKQQTTYTKLSSVLGTSLEDVSVYATKEPQKMASFYSPEDRLNTQFYSSLSTLEISMCSLMILKHI